MSNPTELNPEVSERLRIRDKIDKESWFILLGILAVILSGYALLQTNSSNKTSSDAAARVNFELPRIQTLFDATKEDTENEIRLWITYIQDLEADVKGLEAQVKELEAQIEEQ